jgi:uncharacterized Zn finger protein
VFCPSCGVRYEPAHTPEILEQVISGVLTVDCGECGETTMVIAHYAGQFAVNVYLQHRATA